jgi:hypothetical protein
MNLKTFDQFNEKIDWSKRPWIWFKNIINLEEPEYDEPQKEISPNDIVDMKFELTINILKLYDTEGFTKVLGDLANTCRLISYDITNRGNEFHINCRGKKKYCDIFHNSIKSLLKN